jgi:hypothetical protein
VSYLDDAGRERTEAVAQPSGAYLIVHRARSIGSSVSGGGGAEPSNTTITKVTFAGGVVCRVNEQGWIGGPGACPLPGFTPRPAPRLTAAGVRATVRARLEHRHGEPVVVVRWRAPVAITDAGAAYDVTRRLRGAHTWGSGATQRDIRKGAIVETVFHTARRGLYTGEVTYVFGGPDIATYAAGAPTRRPLKLVVGRYRLRVP